MIAPLNNSTLVHASSRESKQYPPIFLNLNSEALELLRRSAVEYRSGESKKPTFNLSLSERTALVRLNDLEFQSSQYKEAGQVEVFLPDGRNSDKFQSQGRIGMRVTMKQEKPMKLVGDMEAIDLNSPSAQSIIQLLALKPHTASSLSTKTQESSSFVAATLAKVSTFNESQGVYHLREELRPTNTITKSSTVNKSKSSSRPSSVKASASLTNLGGPSTATNGNANTSKATRARSISERATFPATRTSSAEQSTSSNYRASKNSSPPTSGSTSPFMSVSSTPSPPSSDEDIQRHQRHGNTDPVTRSTKRKSAQASVYSANGTTGNSSRQISGDVDSLEQNSIKRAKVNGDTHQLEGQDDSNSMIEDDQTADMFELARKFRDTYGEYRELYALLQHRKSRPPKQVQRLMAMHNQLASWKEKLWSNARSKQVK